LEKIEGNPLPEKELSTKLKKVKDIINDIRKKTIKEYSAIIH
jgi:hypothetical protein